MNDMKLNGYLENYIEKASLFLDKKALQGNYTPVEIPHRDEQIEQLAGILAPALRMEKPSNVFIYGKVGTGKTVVSRYVVDHISRVSKEKNKDVKIIYLNCKMKRVADTEYRLLAQLATAFGKRVPATGLPTDEIYKIFLKTIDKQRQILILVLDEIDQLVNKIGDAILYNLTRLNSELKNVEISIVGISNDLVFMDNVDSRVKSSLSEEELVFPPYNAIQLQDILKNRAKLAFRKGVLEEGLIEKCAAYAARDHGDARRALELLRVAGELAERGSSGRVFIKHLDEAEDKIERDRILDIVKTQPKQFQLALLSIISSLSRDEEIFTGDVYEVYRENCLQSGLKPLTQRRLSDIIAEFDMLGLIHARVISKGRYGRTREISLAIPTSNIPEIENLLQESLGL
jgi:archaeal cell division control protein 6